MRFGLAGIYSNTFSHTWHADAIKRERGTVGSAFTLEEAEILHQRHFYDTIVFVDAEVLRAAATVEVGLGGGFSAAVEVPYLSFSAISADNGIVAFHRAFGFDQAQRTDYPRGRFQLVLQAPYGPLVFDDRRPADGFGDAVLSGRWRRRLTDALLLSADAAVKLPTGSAADFRGSGSADVGALAGITAVAGRQSWFLQAGEVLPGRWRGPLPYDASPFARVLAGTARALGARRRTQVTFCASYEESPVSRDRLRWVSQPAVEVALGVRHALGGAEADLTLDEHLPRFGDGTDVALRLGVRW